MPNKHRLLATTLAVGGAVVTYTISGTVYEADGSTAVQGATVALGSYTATTAANGTYTISSVPAGTSGSMTATKTGYTWTAISVSAMAGNLTSQNYTAMPQYNFRDEFTTAATAGNVNGSAAEPGPGNRIVVDTGNRVTISGGSLKSSGGSTSYTDPAYTGPNVTRAAGVLLAGSFRSKMVNGTTFNWRAGFGYAASSGEVYEGFFCQKQAGGIDLIYNGGTTQQRAIYNRYCNLQYILALRAAGFQAFAKIGGMWKLLELWNTNNTATLIPRITQHGSVGEVETFKYPQDTFLAVPLISDSFSAATSDGLGHAETSGIGAGGGGKTWVDSLGTWGVAGGVASASALDGSGVALRTYDVGTSDYILKVAFTRSAGSGGIVFRYTDTSNYLYLHNDGTNIKLIQRLAGVESELATKAAYGAGQIITIIAEGKRLRMSYNNVMVVNNGVILLADASIALWTGTKVGLYTTDTGNTFDNFVAYARGTGGEYSALGNYYYGGALPKKYFLALGDSKTDYTVTTPMWPEYMASDATDVIPTGVIALAGWTTQNLKDNIDTRLTYATGTPDYILMNIGVNDVSPGSLPNETTWKNNTLYIIDALQTKYPGVPIYLAETWKQGVDSESDTLATWRVYVRGQRTGVYQGIDERVTLKGADNGVSETSDGVHPNGLGSDLEATAWRTLLSIT